jgi:chloramphenicol-sensitive protein RarD
MRKGPPSEHAAARELRAGHLCAATAFIIWGLLPLYLRPLAQVPTLQVIGHRVVWSFVLIMLWLGFRKELPELRAALGNPRIVRRLAITSALMALNWLVYVWAVAHGHVMDASLGYFINPLLSVVLGVWLLGERLSRRQMIAVAIAACGVVYMTAATGRVPWIALALATSFAAYGFLRKVTQVESVPGLAIETLLMMPFAAGWLLWSEWQGSGAFGHASAAVNALLVGSGSVTALPLALFAYGARRIPLSTVGLLQYLGPTLQFLLSLLLFHEPFPPERATGFVMIWCALGIYAADLIWRNRSNRGA